MVLVAWPRLAPQLTVAQRVAGGVREGLLAAQVRPPRAARWGCPGSQCRSGSGTGHGAPPGAWTGAGTTASSVRARISARCTVRVPERSRESPPPMCIRQDASPAVHTSACGRQHVGHLVGEHRGRGVGVLDGEGAAEAAALVGAGQLDQLQPADGAQQLQRPVADPQQPQRVAGRVVGDPVRVVGADVGHPEDVDQELRQLVGAAGQLLGGVGQRVRPRPAGRRRPAGGGSTRRTSRTARRSPRARRRSARTWLATIGTASRR